MGIIRKYIELEVDTIVDKPIKIPFEFKNLESVPERKSVGDSIVIAPITVRTWFRLKPILLSIESADFDKMVAKNGEKEPGSEITELIAKYDSVLMDIICLGIHNKKSEPPKWFRNVLIDNSTWEDIYILLNAILFRIGYTPFCNSITTIRSVSPMTTKEIIACQKNLESWKTSLQVQ